MPEAATTRPSALTPDDVASHAFPTARRGLDPDAVRRFLQEVAAQLREASRREEELRSALAQAEQRAASPELDEAALSAAVGSETARVLQAAHEAAREVVARAEERARALAESAERSLAEERRRASAEAAAAVSAARVEADELVSRAKDECRAMIDEAREARRRILADLAERRHELHVQLEQLRAGKDALAAIVEEVAGSVESVRARLRGAEEEVRVVADEAARAAQAAPSVPGPAVLEEPEEPAPPAAADDAGLAAPASPPEADGLVAAQVAAAPAVPAGDAPGTAGTETGPSLRSVDELFARIRASREEEVGRARALLEEESAGAGRPESVGAGELADDVGAGAPTPPAEAASPALEARDEHLAPAMRGLVQGLKRALRLEQNELLDALRHLPARERLDELLPGAVLAERLAGVAGEHLAEAFAGGRRYAAALLGAPDPPGEAGERLASVERVARGLGEEVSAELRRRIAEGLAPVASADADPAAAVSVAFRALKGARIEGVAADAATEAFALGTLQVAREQRGSVAWLADDGGSACPDCDDNVLAGALAPGTTFPTGQAHPPVHPGCRCLLVPEKPS
ncbi:MAG TPA: DivIVA domain-containing protein [Acidimicrobiales bacterium]|nr:DivIVA domain-containing protein [Acidimicrobiales bacterium]